MWWKYVYWFLILYFPISFIIIAVRLSALRRIKGYLNNVSKYLYGYSELEKKYVDIMFDDHNLENLTKVEIRDKYRTLVKKEHADTLKLPEFPSMDILKEIRRKMN